MDHQDVAEVIRLHELWLSTEEREGSRANLNGAHLSGADLKHANLRGAFLRGAILDQADLSQAELVHADLRDAQLNGANLADANLLLADFSGADLTAADLSNTTRHSENELGHVRQGPRFKDAILKGTNLRHAVCNRSDFSGSILDGVQLSDSTLTEANLANADLRGLELRRANLSNANLSHSDLVECDLTEANLEHANLHAAKLSFANVCGARLHSANLEATKVDGIKYDRKTGFRGIRAETCFGSARFKRFAQDQDFIEEFKEAHPTYYALWLIMTDCGRSIARVVVWSVVFIFGFGITYFYLGVTAFSLSNEEGLGWSVFTALYYSIVTFTTLGFGDITPNSQIAAAVVMLEVIVGYVMLGILISILANKVARRS